MSGKIEAESTTHLDDGGLWIPPELREFTTQVIFRTPRSTIQHFQSDGGELEPFYGMIDESHFGDLDTDLLNPELAPFQVSIKPQGEDPVVLDMEVDADVE